ncbi:hypothetical protein Nepgr_000431 [Nepenthes gracilis]|uniref:Uncharacterized protein n=1 Tax=Nepenthes gracilis TaxID=150966 RepID=A0AAD3RVG1_NEPGR|nr:hypothetical protein Nepgr_000431 [Nepenthes gracilis]
MESDDGDLYSSGSKICLRIRQISVGEIEPQWYGNAFDAELAEMDNGWSAVFGKIFQLYAVYDSLYKLVIRESDHAFGITLVKLDMLPMVVV